MKRIRKPGTAVDPVDGRLPFIIGLALLTMLPVSSRADAPTFAELDGNVETGIVRADPYRVKGTRPADSFQLAGFVDDGLCGEVLAALNQPGQYALDEQRDYTWWWLNSPGLVGFSPLPAGKTAHELAENSAASEFAAVDLDGDGHVEYVYRAARMSGGNYSQQLVIYDSDEREQAPLSRARTLCLRSDGRCDTDTEKEAAGVAVVRSGNSAGEKLRWTSDGDAMLRAAHADQSAPARNAPESWNVSWFVLTLSRGAVLLAVPSTIPADKPFGIGVFSPRRREIGELQCVIRPTFWWREGPPRVLRQPVPIIHWHPRRPLEKERPVVQPPPKPPVKEPPGHKPPPKKPPVKKKPPATHNRVREDGKVERQP